VLNPHDRRPAVKLAVEGRAADGWHPLASLRMDS
jgi:hypothetical protein